MAKALVAQGGRIFEHSEATEFLTEPHAVKANDHLHPLSADRDRHPHAADWSGAERWATSLFQTKLALHTSDVSAGRVRKGRVPDAVWWDTAERGPGQVIETPDGLPFMSATAARQYAATGYAGNGLIFGTLAA